MTESQLKGGNPDPSHCKKDTRGVACSGHEEPELPHPSVLGFRPRPNWFRCPRPPRPDARKCHSNRGRAACAPIGLRSFLRKNPTVWRAGGCALAGSALFFVSTNTAVWLLGTGYTPDASGLLAALNAGLPFWRNAMAGDLLFTGMLFSAWAVAGQTMSSIQPLARPDRVLPDGIPS